MVALIWQYNKQGKLIGRCDARCHDSQNPECRCICEGMNHGRGLSEAITQTAAQITELQSIPGVKVASRLLQYILDWRESPNPS